ncbi:eCIS core domain-containing protein [Neolewinella antarctica]|uniref:eCIS core domain-containing protein n=1 Tax=Neolewinella antarctica TaxID=442734 RepID=A0ABX0X629_9BACT|nr:DUF4157 domain-containing protein [Neolewinella antarctica]NJC24660.1 hypothetical protein [Neolewinella antarctica]
MKTTQAKAAKKQSKPFFQAKTPSSVKIDGVHHAREQSAARESGMPSGKHGSSDELVASKEIVSNLESIAGSGTAIPDQVQAELGDKARTDLARVRVHASPQADALTKRLGANAFTYGKDIFFKGGKYQPATDAGKALLHHELVHVRQQSAGEKRIQRQADEEGNWLDDAVTLGGHFAEEFGESLIDVPIGMAEGGVDAVKGIATMARGAYRISPVGELMDKKQHDESEAALERVATAVREDPTVLWNAIKEPYEKAIKEGRPGKAVGRGIFDVGSAIFGGKGLSKLGKLAKVKVPAAVMKAGKAVNAKIPPGSRLRVISRLYQLRLTKVTASVTGDAEQVVVKHLERMQNLYNTTANDDAFIKLASEITQEMTDKIVVPNSRRILNGQNYNSITGLAKIKPDDLAGLGNHYSSFITKGFNHNSNPSHVNASLARLGTTW